MHHLTKLHVCAGKMVQNNGPLNLSITVSIQERSSGTPSYMHNDGRNTETTIALDKLHTSTVAKKDSAVNTGRM